MYRSGPGGWGGTDLKLSSMSSSAPTQQPWRSGAEDFVFPPVKRRSLQHSAFYWSFCNRFCNLWFSLRRIIADVSMNLAGKLGCVVLVLLAAQGTMRWRRGWGFGCLMCWLELNSPFLNMGWDSRQDLRVRFCIWRSVIINTWIIIRYNSRCIPNSACSII